MWNLSASLMDAKTKRRQLGAACWVTALRGQESRPSLSCSLLPVYFRARPVCSHRYLPLYQQPQRPLHLGYVTETMRLGCLFGFFNRSIVDLQCCIGFRYTA